MPQTPRAKATKRERAMSGITKEELLKDMADAYRAAEGAEKLKLGLELLPYFVPKLKAVEVTSTQDVKVRITIGGIEANEVPGVASVLPSQPYDA